MAHYAELNTNNIVQRVLVVANDITHVDGVEDEALGATFLTNLLPDSGRWVQTSYNGTMRGRYAGIGYRYDEATDQFVPPDWTWDGGAWTPPEPPPEA